jgi:hypothetical protein
MSRDPLRPSDRESMKTFDDVKERISDASHRRRQSRFASKRIVAKSIGLGCKPDIVLFPLSFSCLHKISAPQ